MRDIEPPCLKKNIEPSLGSSTRFPVIVRVLEIAWIRLDKLHESRPVHRYRRPREVPRGTGGAVRRHPAVEAVGIVSFVRLSTSSQSGGVSKPVSLHFDVAMGVHSCRPDGDRLAGRQFASFRARRALLFRRRVARRSCLRFRDTRPLEPPSGRRPADHAVRQIMTDERHVLTI